MEEELKGRRGESEREKGCVQKKGSVRKRVIWGQLNALKRTELTLTELPSVIEPVCSSPVQSL